MKEEKKKEEVVAFDILVCAGLSALITPFLCGLLGIQLGETASIVFPLIGIGLLIFKVISVLCFILEEVRKTK